MSSPSSLRDLYGTSSTPWTFVPPPSPNGSSPAPPATPSVSAPSYTFSSRPAPNSIFELSPGLTEPGGADVVLLLKTLVASVVLQYATTAIAMPWEVGKCLLQVQWVPRDAGDEPPEEDAAAAAAAEEEVRPPACACCASGRAWLTALCSSATSRARTRSRISRILAARRGIPRSARRTSKGT